MVIAWCGSVPGGEGNVPCPGFERRRVEPVRPSIAWFPQPGASRGISDCRRRRAEPFCSGSRWRETLADFPLSSAGFTPVRTGTGASPDAFRGSLVGFLTPAASTRAPWQPVFSFSAVFRGLASETGLNPQSRISTVEWAKFNANILIYRRYLGKFTSQY